MVDIRPVDLSVPGFTFVEGTLLALPFADGSVHSLSSVCVIEHIGLGRYGDPLDAHGTDKAATELVRVLAAGGSLYVTVPVAEESRVEFNAHRTFTREHVLRLFSRLELVEERYVYGRDWCECYLPKRGFGTGLFFFRKQ
jgi:ubiquinone/menaquinone biosynthesis C-methylase UbiE